MKIVYVLNFKGINSFKLYFNKFVKDNEYNALRLYEDKALKASIYLNESKLIHKDTFISKVSKNKFVEFYLEDK